MRLLCVSRDPDRRRIVPTRPPQHQLRLGLLHSPFLRADHKCSNRPGPMDQVPLDDYYIIVIVFFKQLFRFLFCRQ